MYCLVSVTLTLALVGFLVTNTQAIMKNNNSNIGERAEPGSIMSECTHTPRLEADPVRAANQRPNQEATVGGEDVM